MKITANYEIIIDKYGEGHATVVLHDGKIIDCYIDPPLNSNFYPPNTFLKAKIERKIPNLGGYFIYLPNGERGFLKSKNHYQEGTYVLLQSKVFFEPNKPQAFSDSLKIISKYFVIRLGSTGFSFSKKIKKDFEREEISKILKSKIDLLKGSFVLCRSSVVNLSLSDFDKQLNQIVLRIENIKKDLSEKQIYNAGLARDICIEKYVTKYPKIIENAGIFERLGIWDQLEKIRVGRFNLDNGSYLILEQTSAFLTIDVNTGRDHKISKKNINLNACDEIVRIIQVFGFGGKILIDFLPCSRQVKKEIFHKILSFFSEDSAKKNIWGWTKGGIFELEREREKIPLIFLMEGY